MEIISMDNYSDSAVITKTHLITNPKQQWKVGRKYRRRLKKAFDQSGIEIPFPHRTIGAEGQSPLVSDTKKNNNR